MVRITAFQARLARPGPGALWAARFNASEHIRLTQQITGYFQPAAFYRKVALAHVDMAELVQERAVEILQERVAATGRPQLEDAPRPGREANRLETSILHEQNREVTASGWTVGRPGWLEESPAALYWRLIEEGGTAYRTFGFFYPPGGKAELPGAQRTAIMLGQTLNTSRKPFPFLVAATPAYHMMEQAGQWFRTQRGLAASIYQKHFGDSPAPLRGTGT